MKTTLCLIVRDEEKQISECIKSFDGLYDEIVIVDNGSKDKTKTVAQKLGAAVFNNKWKDDFSQARNFALSKVKTPWVLIVDADDRIDKNDKKKLISELKKIKKSTSIITCPYNYNSGTNSKIGQQGDRIRFFKTSLKLKWYFPVHEYIHIPEKHKKNNIRINIPFLHVKKHDDYSGSLKRNVRIMKKHYKEYKNDLRMLYYLSHDNFFLGNFKECIKWSEAYIESNPHDNYELNKVLTREGICFMNLNKPLYGVQSYLTAIAASPKLIEPYLHLGDFYMTNGRHEEGIQFYKMALLCEVPKDSGKFFNQAAYAFYADLRLAYSLPKVNEYKEALKHAKKAQKYLKKDKKLSNLIKELNAKA